MQVIHNSIELTQKTLDEWTTLCVDNTLFIHHVDNIVILEFVNVDNAYKQLVSYAAKIKEDLTSDNR